MAYDSFADGECDCGYHLWRDPLKYQPAFVIKNPDGMLVWQWLCRRCSLLYHEPITIVQCPARIS